MSLPLGSPEVSVESAPRPRPGQPLLAWLVILAAVAFILWRHASESASPTAYADAIAQAEITGRYLVGLHLVFPPGSSVQFYDQANKTMNRGPYGERLRFVILAGELAGPEEARKQLDQLEGLRAEGKVEPTAEQARLAGYLARLYAARQQDPTKEAGVLTAAERDELRQRLGWYGELALAPAGDPDQGARAQATGPAIRTAWAVIGCMSVLGVIGLGGLVGLVALIVLWSLGWVRTGVGPGSHGGIYAEAFAVYMVLFLAFSYGFSMLPVTQGRLMLSGLAALLSLLALVWPVLRGVAWRQVRQDIGWTAGRQPLLEPLLGGACYAWSLPLLGIGVLLMFFLMQMQKQFGWGPDEFGPGGTPTHPVVRWVISSGWLGRLQIIFVACVVAPLVEETMFRGLLYRHLREATAGPLPGGRERSSIPPGEPMSGQFGTSEPAHGLPGEQAAPLAAIPTRSRYVLSVLVSALVVSFVFAVIHPQGFVAIPGLMALALGFTLAREWRGTLIPSMIAHGINNGVAMLLLILIAG
jgi:membrane protease YdiL (CAAX protease family)